MISVINRQFEQISVGGYSVLLRKLKRLLFLVYKTPLYLLAFLIVLIMRLINPIVIIRLGMIDIGRIGGMYHADWYLSQKIDQLHCDRNLNFFYFWKTTNHINKSWVKMWKRVLPWLSGAKLWYNVQRLNRLFRGHQKHELHDMKYLFKNKDLYLNVVLKNKSPNIFFTIREKEKGLRALEKLGIKKGKQYICFHARDSKYLDSVLKTRDWTYHDYRDSSIQNYISAAEAMVNRDYYAVRMGAVVKERIHNSNPRIIDYATNGQRTDFNDIYIGSHCRFFLSSDTGISIIPEMFRKFIVYTNWTRLKGLVSSSALALGLVIFKKFYLKNQNRYMSFSEILNLEFGGMDTNKIFSSLNLELIENTPEEIRAVTIEMDDRLNGTWKTTVEDEELQKRFWALFGSNKLNIPDLRIGAEYLRTNMDLLK